MKHTYHIKMHAVLWATLGVACLASSPAMAGEPAWWTQQKRDCGLPSSLAYNNWDGNCNSSPGGSPSTPSYDYGAAQRAQEAEAERQRQQAEAERQRQAEADRIERERRAEEKRQKDAAFIRDRDAAANTLKGSTGSAMGQLKGISGADSSGLKGSGFNIDSTELKGLRDSVNSGPKTSSQAAPHNDTTVVDARVPSSLPKGLDNSIATAYADAPPGVSERVRKGFQAVMLRDWKVAKAWFQDALNRDPDNAGLKRLVALSDTTQSANQRGKSKVASTPPSKPKPALSPANPGLTLPDANDVYFMFPGLKAIEDKIELDYLFGISQ